VCVCVCVTVMGWCSRVRYRVAVVCVCVILMCCCNTFGSRVNVVCVLVEVVVALQLGKRLQLCVCYGNVLVRYRWVEG